MAARIYTECISHRGSQRPISTLYHVSYHLNQNAHNMSNWVYSREKHAKQNNFALLLMAQLIFILLPAIFEYLQFEWLITAALTLVILVSSYIVTEKPSELAIAIGLAGSAVLIAWLDTSIDHYLLPILNDVAALAFFSYVAIKLGIRRIARFEEVDLNTLFAAVCGFIYLGIIGGFLIELVDLTTALDSFSQPMLDSFSYLYFSFVTITTLGYGDITPVTSSARAISIVLAISGQMYITIVIAVIIGKLLGGQYPAADD